MIKNVNYVRNTNLLYYFNTYTNKLTKALGIQ